MAVLWKEKIGKIEVSVRDCRDGIARYEHVGFYAQTRTEHFGYSDSYDEAVEKARWLAGVMPSLIERWLEANLRMIRDA